MGVAQTIKHGKARVCGCDHRCFGDLHTTVVFAAEAPRADAVTRCHAFRGRDPDELGVWLWFRDPAARDSLGNLTGGLRRAFLAQARFFVWHLFGVWFGAGLRGPGFRAVVKGAGLFILLGVPLAQCDGAERGEHHDGVFIGNSL